MRQERVSNPVIAESALDRPMNCGHRVVLIGRSYRPMLRPDRKSSVAEEVGTTYNTNGNSGWVEYLILTRVK